MIGWGALGNVYGAGTRLITFPGIPLLLSPLALITGALGMSESFPFVLAHPSAWLVLGPYEILISSSALFACDALAERLGVPRGRRAALCLAEGAFLFNVSVCWGHPEDALALALALYALVFAFDGRWTGAGWLFGAAVATQPLVLLMLPVLLALAGRSRVTGLLARAHRARGCPARRSPRRRIPCHRARLGGPAELPPDRPRDPVDPPRPAARRVGEQPGGCRRAGPDTGHGAGRGARVAGASLAGPPRRRGPGRRGRLGTAVRRPSRSWLPTTCGRCWPWGWCWPPTGAGPACCCARPSPPASPCARTPTSERGHGGGSCRVAWS